MWFLLQDVYRTFGEAFRAEAPRWVAICCFMGIWRQVHYRSLQEKRLRPKGHHCWTVQRQLRCWTRAWETSTGCWFIWGRRSAGQETKSWWRSRSLSISASCCHQWSCRWGRSSRWPSTGKWLGVRGKSWGRTFNPSPAWSVTDQSKQVLKLACTVAREHHRTC